MTPCLKNSRNPLHKNLGMPKIADMSQPFSPDEIIDALGGTSEVAKMFQIKPPSVSEWRKNGIPKDKLQILRLTRPDVFAQLEAMRAEGVKSRPYRQLPNRKNVLELRKARPRVDDALPAPRPLSKKTD